MTITNKALKRRIIEISWKNKLSHLSSCLTAVDILADIYETKKPEDKVVLSQGHAGLALYAVLEKYENQNAEELFALHGVHPNRDLGHGLWCSAGSLGHGLGIALGMALADKTKKVHCLISDGESMEGSIWEALRLKCDLGVDNLKVYVNMNGASAYDRVIQVPLIMRLQGFGNWNDDKADRVITVSTDSEELPFLKPIDSHYHVMTEEEYKQALEILK